MLILVGWNAILLAPNIMMDHVSVAVREGWLLIVRESALEGPSSGLGVLSDPW